MSKLPQLFLRGHPVQSLPEDELYKDGILETMRCHNGKIPLWPLHRERLARALGLGESLLADIDQCVPLLAAQRGHKMAIARLRVGLIDGQWCWDLSFLPLQPTEEAELGVHLFPCKTHLPVSQRWNSGCKFLSRSRYNRAKSELPEGDYLDGLMLDTEGRVIESLRCNLLARFGDGWITPNLERCGVRGVMRDWLSSRIQWQERDMDIRDLCGAEEIALCNSVRGVLPVVEIVGHKRWKIGSGVRGLQQLIMETLW
ncbi:aminotransferase class IV [Microbulbifer sp. THAF38]|uniref:aminotransferase class IV n=1 Tax=Microbulbifer sp. THAF38 TaxID=2587856 RepID=UPI001267E139|nr:aminotransferase class IV [Microbulbifer sp. THAF38]QFT54697.1 Aminodeoxychorismate lyase [Microbulbifer sp. THAF38]